jgi:hypothetical protein
MGNYVRIYLREIGWEVVDWIHLAQDMDKWIMNLRASYEAGNFSTSSATISFSRKTLLP